MDSDKRAGDGWIVTGASSGIGRAVADLLAADGARLILSGRNPARLAEVAEEARRRGAESVIEVPGCLRDPIVRDALVRRGLDDGCDGLFNAAGFSTSEVLCDLEAEDVSAQIAVNTRVPTDLTRRLTPAMAARGRGFVVNVASLAGWQGVPTQSVYAATKAYVTSFTVALHGELRGSGVCITALCPGLVRTRFFERAGLGMDRRFARVGNWHQPDTVAEAALAGVRANRMIVIPGWRNRLSPLLQRLVPRSFVAAAARRMMEKV